MPGTRTALAAGRAALGLGLIYYLLFGRDNEIDLDRFMAAGWLLVVLPALGMVGASVEAFRLGLLCRSQAVHLEFGHGLRLVLVSLFFGFFVPGGTGGDVAKIYYLAADNRGKAIELAVVVFVERLTGFVGLIITVMALALINLPLVADFPVIRWIILILAVLFGVTALFGALIYLGWIGNNRFYRAIEVRLPLQRLRGRIADAVRAFRVHKSVLLTAVLSSVLGNVAMITMFLVSGSVFLPNVSSAVVGFLSMLGTFANALPLTPGGLGVGEAAFEGLFGLLGLSGGAMLMVAWRLGMVPLGIAGGGLYIFGVRRKAALGAGVRVE